MNSSDSTLAARFFFKNCSVSLHMSGEMRISHTLTPEPDDVILDRNFIPADSPSEFIGNQSDFYRFLDATSSTNVSLIKKLTAIGYLLCNKLPKHNPTRIRSFICVNELEYSMGNGKTLFCKAISQYCNTVRICGRDYMSNFAFDQVAECTQLVLLDDFPVRCKIQCLFNKCTDDWVIHRKGYPPLVIEFEKTPHLMITTALPMSKVSKAGSFLRRFCVLEFSSFFGPNHTIHDYFGHYLFLDWNDAQWQMFDNLMFYCVREYVRAYSRGADFRF